MDSRGALERLGELARAGEPCALATVVWRQGPSSGKQGSRAVITADGELDGWIGGACAEPAVIRAAREAMADGNARLLLLGTPGQFGQLSAEGVPDGMTVVPVSCQSEGALQVYIEPMLPAPHLVVVGGSPMARALAAMARALGWAADLVSPQDFTAGRATGRSMVVIAAQGHGDEDVMACAVGLRPAYLGLVASRKRAEAVLGYLADRGVPADQLGRVHAPAGLDLGRTSHEEIAVAILAQLVQLRAAGELAAVPGPRREAQPGQRAEPAPGGPAEAADPVCGMTVRADASAMPLEYEGTTYYFCCAGCRRSFERDPREVLT